MRDKRIDNAKGVLIFLVVLGHLLEFSNSGVTTYTIIYAFHMPALFFLMGMVAKPSKITITRDILIYAIFQIAYYLFDALFLKNNSTTFQFIIPFWMLWFTIVGVYCNVVLLVINRLKINKVLAITASIIVSLIVGYVEQIGYEFSLSRAFTFLPYYLAGVVFRDSKLRNKKYIIIALLTAIITLYIIFRGYYSSHVLFGAYSYSMACYSPIDKMIVYFVAFACTLSLYMYMPDKEVPILTAVGKNTLPIYLLHGFIIRALRNIDFYTFNPNINYMQAIITSVIIVFILSKVRFTKVN